MIEVGGIYKLKKIKDFFGTNTEDEFKVLKISGDTVYCQNVETKELNMFNIKDLIDPEFPDDIYSDFQIVMEKLNNVIRPMNLSFWKDLKEDAMASTAAAVPALSGGGTSGSTGMAALGPAPTGQYGARVNGIPVVGQSVKSMKKKKKKKKNEELQLVAPADPDIQFGDTYFAHTEQDVFDCLDKMIPGDATGVFLKHKEYDETCELTIEMLDEDLYKLSLEEDTEENSNDWEGKGVMDTDAITKEDAILVIQSLLTDYKVVTNKVDEKVESIINDLLEDFHEEYEQITELIAQQLDRMNFEYANTEDIIYKKEGKYKYLLKFDNEKGYLKFKVSQDDNVLYENEWKLEEGQDISPIFQEIESVYERYGI